MAYYKEFLDQIDRKAYHEGESQWEEDGYLVTRTYQYSPPGCHETCGVLFFTKDDKLEKVEGDPLSPFTNGKLCMRCLNLVEAVNDESRMKYPLRRVGERGENKWERISWSEAYDEIERNVREIWESDGPESIICTLGTGRNVNWQIPFFGHAVLKTPNVCNAFFTGYACYLPRVCGAMAPLGDFPVVDASQASELRYLNPDWKNPEVIVMWGCETLVSNADGFFGHWLVYCVQEGSKIISIDPRLTWWGARAHYHLQIRPGTDAALACAMLHVIITEDLYDHEFVDYWCAGLDELAASVKDTTPEWAAAICDLDADDIRGAARLYASGNNATIQWGLAYDQQLSTLGLTLATCDLMALCGNLDVPGGNILMRGAFECNVAYAAGDQYVSPEANARKLTTSYALDRPDVVDFMANSSSDGIIRAIETGNPYPIKMMWIQSENPVACMGMDAPRVFECMKKLPYVVVVDPIMTPTAIAFADLVLPVASGPERDSVRAWWTPLRATTKVTSFYETKSDEQIIVDLGKRLNPELFAELGIDTDEDYLNWFLHYGTGGNVESSSVESGRLSNAPTLYKKDFKELREQGGYEYDEWNTIYRKYEKGLLRPDGGLGFGTPTGRVELVPLAFKSWGVTPYPHHTEPLDGPISTPEAMEEYPLILTTGARSWEFFHSEHRNLATAREFHPYPLVTMNPQTAEKYGVKEGQWAWIDNGHGRFKQLVKTSPVMKPSTISAEHAWWYPEKDPAEPTLFGVFDSNPNNCSYTFETGEGGCGSAIKSMICKIYPVEPGDASPTEVVVAQGGFGDYVPGVMAGRKSR